MGAFFAYQAGKLSRIPSNFWMGISKKWLPWLFFRFHNLNQHSSTIKIRPNNPTFQRLLLLLDFYFSSEQPKLAFIQAFYYFWAIGRNRIDLLHTLYKRAHSLRNTSRIPGFEGGNFFTSRRPDFEGWNCFTSRRPGFEGGILADLLIHVMVRWVCG